MRKAGIVFLMALALAMATALPTVAATRSLRRSRFLATLGSCSAELPCPYLTDPSGFSYPGLDCCNGICIDTGYDIHNCGGCGYYCGSWPWICCDGYCFNSQNDYENCGRCGNFCDGGCIYGVCEYAV
ncbi:unnamed protein product [Urochloa humidicola]